MFANQLQRVESQEGYSIMKNTIPLNFPELSILLHEKIRTKSSFKVQMITRMQDIVRNSIRSQKHFIKADIEFIYSEFSSRFLGGGSSSYCKSEMLTSLVNFCKKRDVTIVRISHGNSHTSRYHSEEVRLILSYEHSIGEMSRKLLRIQGFKLVIAEKSMPNKMKMEVDETISSQKNQLVLWM